MIHINGFGVKKQPPIGSLSNICLALVKTVPLLAASMCDTMVSLSSRCRWFSQPKIMVIEFDDVHVTFVTVNFEKKVFKSFLKSRYQMSDFMLHTVAKIQILIQVQLKTKSEFCPSVYCVL